jgi:hypothetical protein
VGGGRPPEGRVGGEDFLFVYPVGDAVEEGGVACGCYSDGFGVGSVLSGMRRVGDEELKKGTYAADGRM